MENYLFYPIMDELVQAVEDNPHDKNTVQAMVSGILNLYFPPANGFILYPTRFQNNNNNNDNTLTEFTFLRI